MKDSIHATRAKSTLKEMETQLAKLKQEVSFREYVGSELIINIFKARYEKWLK
jgi:hypothetical protein